MQTTSIEWAESSWNPVRGCSRVSEGCRHCYAENLAARFGGEGEHFHGFAKRVAGDARWTGRVELLPHKLAEPLRMREPRRIFVNSMSDLFHESLTELAIAAVFGVMAAASQHTFLVLTKRPGRAAAWFEWVGHRDAAGVNGLDPRNPKTASFRCEQVATGALLDGRDVRKVTSTALADWPLPNVWLGTSVEDQPTADERTPHLLRCPAAVRFVSYEPALGPVNFTPYLKPAPLCPFGHVVRGRRGDGIAYGYECAECGNCWTGPLPRRPALDWIIVGGESGRDARPFDVAWARSTVEQCRAAGVAVFVKQLGAVPLYDAVPGDTGTPVRALDGHLCYSLRHPKGGDPAEWPEDLRVRELPGAAP